MTCGLEILDAGLPADRVEWERIWSGSPERDVFARPAYLELFSRANDRVMAAAFARDGGGHILYPFLLRDIPGGLGERPLKDITTAYGYGGPAAWGTESVGALAMAFWPLFDEWARGEGVVSEFVRFSLFSGAEAWHPGDVVERQPNVVVPVAVDDDELWRSFEPKVRKNVKRARTSGVDVVVDRSGERLDDFLSIYTATMERREAAERYYFAREFFERIHRELRGGYAYFHAYMDGRAISTELVLVSEHAVYSYLGGTDSDAFPHRPNDLLKYEVIRWARAEGKSHFVLGGGVSPGDGIERYKRAFAPHGVQPFRTGQRILIPDAYQELTRAVPEPATASSYFPAYRVR